MASSTSPKTARRFAPTPSGPLHMGSLYLAIADYLMAKQSDSHWLVRIDDVDKPRVAVNSVLQILQTLNAHGLIWDSSIVYQSQQHLRYDQALARLCQQQLVFACYCSRKQLMDAGHINSHGICYPGTCRDNIVLAEDLPTTKGVALRVRVEDKVLSWNDKRLGVQQENLAQTTGDFVIRRTDGIYSFHLATAVDDYEMGISHVTRGEDLLSSAGRQIYLQQLLGYQTPEYMHLPLVVDARGQKLAKQSYSKAVDNDAVGENLRRVLQWLQLDDFQEVIAMNAGQQLSDKLPRILQGIDLEERLSSLQENVVVED